METLIGVHHTDRAGHTLKYICFYIHTCNNNEKAGHEFEEESKDEYKGGEGREMMQLYYNLKIKREKKEDSKNKKRNQCLLILG